MELIIRIDCDNAAFGDREPREDDNFGPESAAILRGLADKLNGLFPGEVEESPIILRDHNGNTVGECVIRKS
jgi:hypothetical protein